MNHPDGQELAAFALDEPIDSPTLDHVSGCIDCEHEVGRLHDVVAAATRLGGEPVVLEPPPAHVWTAILAQTTEPQRRSAPGVDVSKRRRRVTGGVVGFALGVAATVALAVVINQDGATPRPVPEAGRTIAIGVVRPLDSASATRGALAVVRSRGQRSLRIRLNQTTSSDSDFVQAWLLDPRTNDMIALGVMGSRTETFPLSEGVDLSAYSAVDISLEPFDGDPQHSAISLARGSLGTR